MLKEGGCRAVPGVWTQRRSELSPQCFIIIYKGYKIWHCTKLNPGFKEATYWRKEVTAFSLQNWLISIRNSAWNFRPSWSRFLFLCILNWGSLISDLLFVSVCTNMPKSPHHLCTEDPWDTPGFWLPTWNCTGRKNERPGAHAANTAMPSRWSSFFSEFFFWNFWKRPEAFAAPQSQPSDMNWVMEITSDRSLPEQRTWVPECPKNRQASPHCQWRWSRGSYWALTLLPQCICKVHRCPHNPPVCSGDTLSKEGKKQCKSAQNFLQPFWKFTEIWQANEAGIYREEYESLSDKERLYRKSQLHKFQSLNFPQGTSRAGKGIWSALDQRSGKWPCLGGPAVRPRRAKDRTVNMQGHTGQGKRNLDFPGSTVSSSEFLLAAQKHKNRWQNFSPAQAWKTFQPHFPNLKDNSVQEKKIFSTKSWMFSHQIFPLLSIAVLLRCGLRAAGARAAVQCFKPFLLCLQNLAQEEFNTHFLPEPVFCPLSVWRNPGVLLGMSCKQWKSHSGRQTHCLRCDQCKAIFWHFFHSSITPIIFLSVTSISFVLPSPVTPTSDSYFLIAWYCIILPTVINTRPNSWATTSLGIKKDIFIKNQAVTSAITSFPAFTDTAVGAALCVISSPACTEGEGWC